MIEIERAEVTLKQYPFLSPKLLRLRFVREILDANDIFARATDDLRARLQKVVGVNTHEHATGKNHIDNSVGERNVLRRGIDDSLRRQDVFKRVTSSHIWLQGPVAARAAKPSNISPTLAPTSTIEFGGSGATRPSEFAHCIVARGSRSSSGRQRFVCVAEVALPNVNQRSAPTQRSVLMLAARPFAGRTPVAIRRRMHSRLNFTPSPLTLGAAQFGMSYGIANTAGQLSETDVHKILDAAADAGITTVDTAALYGSSEQRIGRWLAARGVAAMHVITKVPALPRGIAGGCQASLVERLSASMRALGIEQLPLVLTHSETDLFDPYILHAFRVATERKMIGRFGASTYRPEVALRLIETTPIAALQVPASVLDHRFIDAGVFAAAKAREICVFVRSVFLQGALVGNPELLPPKSCAARRSRQTIRSHCR